MRSRGFNRKIEKIFMPQIIDAVDRFYGKSDYADFAHYTSASSAISIIQSKSVWMRSAACMDDYKEIQHGLELINEFLSKEHQHSRFITAIDKIHPNCAASALINFKSIANLLKFNTYMSSISEHDTSENEDGRLSMWRAFGGQSPSVALVFRIPRNIKNDTGLNITFSPVSYTNRLTIQNTLRQVTENIEENQHFLKKCTLNELHVFSFYALLHIAIGSKHAGFREEREWRVSYSPEINRSETMKSTVETISNVPQVVYSIPLHSENRPALTPLELENILHRVIIGPSQYSFSIYQALRHELVRHGIPEYKANNMISMSSIPIRK